MNEDHKILPYCLVATFFALCLLVIAPVFAEDEEKLVVEDAYLELILAWARGSETAVAELSDLQQRLAEHMAVFEIDASTLPRLQGKPNGRQPATSYILPQRAARAICLRLLSRPPPQRRLLRAVQVKLDRRGLEVRAREGYVDQ